MKTELLYLLRFFNKRQLAKKEKSGRRDSNPRPSAWKANALSTELLPHYLLWARMDSNHRRRKPADLQSAPFGHSGTCPIINSEKQIKRAEDGTQTRDPQLGRLMLYQLSYFRKFCGQRWIRTTEGVSQQIYSLPHLATLVFALPALYFKCSLKCVAKVRLFFLLAREINHFYCCNCTFIPFISQFPSGAVFCLLHVISRY